MKFCLSSVRLVFRLFPLLVLVIALAAMAASAGPIRVVVWDEREAAQKSAYGDFLGNTVAAYLAKQPDFVVKSVGLDDPEQGLSDDVLNNCDVLIWWGHEKHGQVTDAHVSAVLQRLKEGRLSLIALHSAHWSKPFIAAMNTRAVDDALQSVPEAERAGIKVVQVPDKGGLPGPKEPITPWFRRFKTTDGTDTLEVHLPRCVFPVVENKGLPSHIVTMLPKHPIAEGIPASFEIPQTEIYAGPFFVPKPDAMIFLERWDDGRTFTSGCAWQVEKGRVFYFRPGHETYPIFKEEFPLKIVANAVRWAHP
ncbi:MAG TPA: ThuA domain-containing protein [Candidatus Saccharimonadales bacterium]|nr:ThuA domain-containing protein [Candidatus Saccharimonadales bacterium]